MSTTTGGSASLPPEDPIAGLKRLFVDVTQRTRIMAGQAPARRAVFLKPHGSAFGSFRMRPDLPPELRAGVFAHDAFPAWVRFSSDTVPGAPDLATTCGVGIKLIGVPGPKLLEPDALTQDFVLQNIDVFFVDDAQAMFEFTYAGVQLHDYPSYIDAHPVTKAILDRMRHPVESVACIDYWSGLPAKLGEGQYVKYKLVANETSDDGDPRGAATPAPGTADTPATPVTSNDPTAPVAGTANDPNYLTTDLARRLLRGEVRFTFCVQLRTDPERMPLDRATVAWDSPAIPLADLVLPAQDVAAPGQAAYAENLAYTAWNSLPEHEPVGSLQAARKVVYAASARSRRDANGIPLVEPRVARPQPPA